MPTEADRERIVITDADRKLADEYFNEGARRFGARVPGSVTQIVENVIAFARERWQQEQAQSQPAEPPLPTRLKGASVVCSSYFVREDKWERIVVDHTACAVPLPHGSVVFVATGEFREPLPGEWFEGTNGLVALNESTCFGAKRKIVHRIEVTK